LSVFCIPITITDPLFCGIILDMLCRESSELVVPNYYDKALKHKYTRDTESEEMLNLARETIWFDFGFVYSQALNDLGSFLDILSSTPNISSAWASKKSAYEAGLESLIDCFKEN
ncbi:MAG: hypothetical protein ACI3XM_10425, partial [Eubacteriales bacterium]